MPGWLMGAAVVVVVMALMKRRRYLRHAYYGVPLGGWGDRSRWEAGPRFRRHGGGHRLQRGLLRGLFLRLDTSPGQEKAIVFALAQARERVEELKHELSHARRDIAALIASDVLEPASLDALLASQRAIFERMSQEAGRTLSTVHEALDTEQRRELGALLADGSLHRVLRPRHFC